MKKIETRFLTRELRIARTATGAPSLEGYAAVFNSLSEDLGGFREQILPGAFQRSLANGADVRCLFNHDESLILGRSKAKTLTVSEDETGLYFRCDLPDTAIARDLAISIERGDVDQCSFGFYCVEDDWAMMDDTPVRSVKVAEVFDCLGGHLSGLFGDQLPDALAVERRETGIDRGELANSERTEAGCGKTQFERMQLFLQPLFG